MARLVVADLDNIARNLGAVSKGDVIVVSFSTLQHSDAKYVHALISEFSGHDQFLFVAVAGEVTKTSALRIWEYVTEFVEGAGTPPPLET